MGDKISYLTFGSVYKILFLGIWGSFISLGLVILVFSVIAPNALTINERQAAGIGDGLRALMSMTVGGGIAAALLGLPAAAFIKIFGRWLPLQTIYLENPNIDDFN